MCSLIFHYLNFCNNFQVNKCYFKIFFFQNKGLREASLVAAQESYKRGKNDVYAAFCEEQLKLRRY